MFIISFYFLFITFKYKHYCPCQIIHMTIGSPELLTPDLLFYRDHRQSHSDHMPAFYHNSRQRSVGRDLLFFLMGMNVYAATVRAFWQIAPIAKNEWE